jgi:transposase
VNNEEYIAELRALNKQLLDQVTQLTFELGEMKRLLFGRSSERFIPADTGNPAQLDLALLMQEAAAKPVKEEVVMVKKKGSASKPTGRQPLPAHLERRDTILEPEVDTTGLEKIGEAVTERLNYIPGKLVVDRTIRPKYARVSPDGAAYTEIVIAPLPDFAIEKGIAAPGLLAQIIVDKHSDHLPVYRQIKRYQRLGVKLSASTISGWLDATADLLMPLTAELKKVILAADYIQADETPLPVLNGETQGAAHQGYLWAYHSPPDQLVFYDYQTGRNKDGPVKLLKHFTGYLQTDGYAVYEHAEIGGKAGIVLMHCLAHARRYFEKSLGSDKTRAEYFLKEVQKLYAIERRGREENLTPEQILELRAQESLPILAALKQWLQEQYLQVLPKSPIGKAIGYALPRWEKLTIYTQDARLQPDNNLVENCMRGIAVGRKNFLFAGSNEGGKRLALFYSLLESCKKKNINPWEYLTDILERMPTTRMSELRSLLPDTWQPASKHTDL